MKAKANTKDGNPQIQIFCTYPGTPDIRPSPKDNTAVFRSNLFWRSCIGDKHHFDIEVPEGTVDQVIELTVIIDNADRTHYYLLHLHCWTIKTLQLYASTVERIFS